MMISAAKLTFRIQQSHSLKDKRMIVRSVKDKTRKRYNVSLVEVDSLDDYQRITLGISIVAQDYFHATQSRDRIVRFIENQVDGNLVSILVNDFDIND